jgi:hypothetical protein
MDFQPHAKPEENARPAVAADVRRVLQSESDPAGSNTPIWKMKSGLGHFQSYTRVVNTRLIAAGRSAP